MESTHPAATPDRPQMPAGEQARGAVANVAAQQLGRLLLAGFRTSKALRREATQVCGRVPNTVVRHKGRTMNRPAAR